MTHVKPETGKLSSEDLWTLMKAFFEARGLSGQHLDSYNEFVERDLNAIVQSVGGVSVYVKGSLIQLRFGKIHVGRPRVFEVDGSETEVTPMDCRLRNLTYSAPLHLEVTPIVDGKEGRTELIYVGSLPVMLKSKICPLSQMTEEELIAIGEDPADPGGYFIVNGSERIIIGIEDLAPNRILVDYDENSRVYRAKVFSTIIGYRTKVELKMKRDGSMTVSMPSVPSELPFIVVMKALGVERDREIAELVSPDPEIYRWLEPSFEKAKGVDTQEEAMLYIGNRVAFAQAPERRKSKAMLILDRNFLLHLGRTPEARLVKARFLAEMARRVIELRLGLRKPDDKDHYANKRIRLAGQLLGDLFRAVFRDLVRDMSYQLDRVYRKLEKGRLIPLRSVIRSGILTDRIQHALATGNWGRGRVGVTQLLDRTNSVSTLSHLRRIQSPLSRSQPNFEARDLHSTHWGRLCPNETPEGSNCGLVKNLALMATISVSANVEEVEQILLELGCIPFDEADERTRIEAARVYVDGVPFGFTFEPEELAYELRRLRRIGRLSSEVNVAYFRDVKELYVNCDPGRCRRPLIVVDNGKPLISKSHIEALRKGILSWDDLVKMGLIEYVDAEEEENCVVALKPEDVSEDTTHLEIAPYTIFGVCASLIPYAEHNHSPRNSYEAAMAKQALGVYAANYHFRVDSRGHLLHYPQIPLVQTKPMEVIGYYTRPSGQNFVVAVISYSGYNMEDAIIFNKSSIDRGLARSTFFKVYEAESRQYMGGETDRFEIPSPDVRGYKGEKYYSNLEPDGLIYPESNVSGGEVFIGRTSPPRFIEEYRELGAYGLSRRDTSISLKPTESGIVDTVILTVNSQGNKVAKVKIREPRIPELGDKFASRHGQKGVIGMVFRQEDMPYTEDGLTPDIIINPHAIPSRMTVGQLIESIAGKVAALTGRFIDGTAFDNTPVDKLEEALKKLGFRYGGREIMYDGATGYKFEADIFIGVVYYQKLHHMVADKIHARARGQVQMLTRQPTEGRARGGGLRFGEMERDCLIAHGAAALLKDRMVEESDETTIYVCKNCGFIGYFDARRREYRCHICGDKAKIIPVKVAYAFKLLLQELMSLCIAPRLIVEEVS